MPLHAGEKAATFLSSSTYLLGNLVKDYLAHTAGTCTHLFQHIYGHILKSFFPFGVRRKV